MRVPASTYRIQLLAPESDPHGHGVTFADVESAVPAIAALGVGAISLSPLFEAAPGSTDGADVVDPDRVAEALGGAEALRSLRVAAKIAGLGLVVEFVPGHLAVSDAWANAKWWDVLAKGEGSEFFSFFDLDVAADNGIDGAVALPVLDSATEPELVLDELEDAPVLRAGDKVFPVAEGTGEGSASEVHERQFYRLVERGAPLLGYRRAHTDTGLAGLRQEDEKVVERTHRGLAKLVREDLVDGVRIADADGLTSPVGYTRLLRELVGEDRWIVLDKILGPGEILDPALPVQGTAGYDILDLVATLFLDPRSESTFAALAQHHVGDVQGSAELKREVVLGPLLPEARRLARAVLRAIDAVGGDGGDGASPAGPGDAVSLRIDSLVAAIAELVAATPVYRADYPVLRPVLPLAFADSESRAPELAGALAELAIAVARPGESAARLAQLTDAATTTAEEDCRLYRLGRLVALHERGADPERWAIGVPAFHTEMAARAVMNPYSMTTLGSHETRRGEDVRARLLALTEFPDEWAAFAENLRGRHAPPARDAGYVLLQDIVGVWPAAGLDSLPDRARAELRARLHAHARRVARAAGVHSSRNAPDAAFESGLAAWIDGWFEKPRRIDAFVSLLAPAGRGASLAAKAIQLLSPGVPELYQGTEVWEDSLGAPDNRRPVSYDGGDPGHPKTELVRACLGLRRRFPEVFTDGEYLPLPVSGAGAGRVLAFSRGLRRSTGGAASAQVVLVARLRHRGVEAWTGRTSIALPAGEWRVEVGGRSSGRKDDEHAGTGDDGQTPITGTLDGGLLAEFPVIVLVRA